MQTGYSQLIIAFWLQGKKEKSCRYDQELSTFITGFLSVAQMRHKAESMVHSVRLKLAIQSIFIY